MGYSCWITLIAKSNISYWNVSPKLYSIAFLSHQPTFNIKILLVNYLEKVIWKSKLFCLALLVLNVSECWQVLECPENRESEDGVGLVDVAAQASDTLTQAGCLFLNAHGTIIVPAYFKKKTAILSSLAHNSKQNTYDVCKSCFYWVQRPHHERSAMVYTTNGANIPVPDMKLFLTL